MNMRATLICYYEGLLSQPTNPRGHMQSGYWGVGFIVKPQRHWHAKVKGKEKKKLLGKKMLLTVHMKD